MNFHVDIIRLTLLSFLIFAMAGCGDSDFEETSNPSTPGGTQGATTALPGAQIPDIGSPDFVAGSSPDPVGAAGPVAARASFTFTGSSNANMTFFNVTAASIVQAGFRPNPTQATSFVFSIQNGSASGAKRVLTLDISGSASKIAVGDRFSADSSKTGARARLAYIDQPDAQPTSAKVFLSTGGEVVITQLSSNSATVRLDHVRFAPGTGGASKASGDPVVNGEGSFTF